MNKIQERQYRNLRLHFDSMVWEILGYDYKVDNDLPRYDRNRCKDVVREYKRMKKSRDIWQNIACVSISFVMALIFILSRCLFVS